MFDTAIGATRHHARDCRRRREKGGTYEVPNNQAIQELQRAHHHQERQKGVQQLNTLRRLLQVVVPYALYDVLCGAAVLGRARSRGGAGVRWRGNLGGGLPGFRRHCGECGVLGVGGCKRMAERGRTRSVVVD